MKRFQYLALATGMLLFLSGVLVNANALRKQPTAITLEVSPSVVNANDPVTFAGTLVNSNSGEGIRDKKITVFSEGPIVPVSIADGETGIDGAFSITWAASLGMNRDTPVTVYAQFDGDETAEPTRTGKMTFRIALSPLNLEITTDGNKNRYLIGSTTFFSVALHDGMGHFLDSDVTKATYDGNFISLNKVDVGRYTFETPRLVKFEQHQFGVFVEKFGYASAQKSLTITVFGAKVAKPVKVTATKADDNVMIRVRDLILSPGDIYTFTGKLLHASAVGGSAENWQFDSDPATETFGFKSLKSSLKPGEIAAYKVKVEGTALKLLWHAFDLNGVELASGATVVKLIRAK